MQGSTDCAYVPLSMMCSLLCRKRGRIGLEAQHRIGSQTQLCPEAGQQLPDAHTRP